MTPKQIQVRVELPEQLHAKAKSKAAMARQTLRKWLIEVIRKTVE